MTNYVVGFAFNKKRDHVVLIEKTKPKWQAGHYNGVGGKIEKNERITDAMIREFEEETTLKTSSWTEYITFVGNIYRLHVFATELSDEELVDLESPTEEEVVIMPVNDILTLKHPIVDNIRWTIPMGIWALDNNPHLISVFVR